MTGHAEPFEASEHEQKLITRRARRNAVIGAVEHELEKAYAKHGDDPWGRHEAYAIALEELDEAWEAIKGDEPIDHLRHELAQLAAVCIRYLEQPRDRYEPEP